MSSQNQVTCETSSLLGGSQPADWSSDKTLSRKQFRPETLLIPFVFATRLGNVVTSTTLFELVRQTICKFSNISRGDPSSLVAGGPSSGELCNAPEVVRHFTAVTAMLGVVGGIISMVGCGFLSRISPHCGRKPAFLFILIVEITWSSLIPASQFLRDGLSHWVFFLGMLIHLFSSAFPSGYLVNMYVVDVCVPDDRTATLSKIGGWSALGTCIPLLLGGAITTKTGNPFIVFYIAAATFVTLLIYVLLVLPETFPEGKRNALRSERSTHSTTTRLAHIPNIFEPLKMLAPAGMTGGIRNWRLTWCAMHAFVFVTGHPFSSSAWLVFVTSKYHLTPADNGLFFTASAASSIIVLTIIVPLLVRFLRPYYIRRIVRSSPAGQEAFGESETVGSGTSDHLNVHLAVASCVVVTFFFLCVAVSTTKVALLASAVFVGISSMHTPTMRSLIAGSVPPLKQGDAMAAIEMVDSVARVFSPIVMGSLLSATIETAVPHVVFFVQSAVVLVSAGLLFLVRDADGYRESNETSQDRSTPSR